MYTHDLIHWIWKEQLNLHYNVWIICEKCFVMRLRVHPLAAFNQWFQLIFLFACFICTENSSNYKIFACGAKIWSISIIHYLFTCRLKYSTLRPQKYIALQAHRMLYACVIGYMKIYLHSCIFSWAMKRTNISMERSCRMRLAFLIITMQYISAVAYHRFAPISLLFTQR